MLILNILSLHENLKFEVYAVNIPTSKGRRGILSQAAPCIIELSAGIVEGHQSVEDNYPRRWMIPGGFCHVKEDSINTLCILTVDHMESVEKATHF